MDYRKKKIFDDMITSTGEFETEEIKQVRILVEKKQFKYILQLLRDAYKDKKSMKFWLDSSAVSCRTTLKINNIEIKEHYDRIYENYSFYINNIELELGWVQQLKLKIIFSKLSHKHEEQKKENEMRKVYDAINSIIIQRCENKHKEGMLSIEKNDGKEGWLSKV